MDKRALLLKSLAGLAQLVVVMAVLMFVPAWTIHFWQAWVFLSLFTLASAAITFRLFQHDPKLLERRVKGGPAAEKEPAQKVIQTLAGLAFLATCVVPALDRRFGWTEVPRFVVVLGDVLVAIAFYIVFRVFEENSFTSSTVEIQPEQRVISTGPYSIVRHPMYAGGFVLIVGIPLALGSLVGLVPAVALMASIVWRLLDEERFLAKNLAGYDEFRQKTRYRLIPHVW